MIVLRPLLRGLALAEVIAQRRVPELVVSTREFTVKMLEPLAADDAMQRNIKGRARSRTCFFMDAVEKGAANVPNR